MSLVCGEIVSLVNSSDAVFPAADVHSCGSPNPTSSCIMVISANSSGAIASRFTCSVRKNRIVELQDVKYIPDKGPLKCCITLFSWKLNTHPPPRSANNVELYTFVMLFSGKSDPPPPSHNGNNVGAYAFVTLMCADPYTALPPLHYARLEWPHL